MKNYLLFGLTTSLIACDLFFLDESQADLLIPEIPAIELQEGNSQLSRTRAGVILLDSVKYSGYLVTYYQDSTIKTKKSYFQGRMEGDFISYYPNGQTHSQRPYHLGEKHGEHVGFYADGQLMFKYYFVNGFGQGTHKEWYPNGDLKAEMNYTDGKEMGAQRVWRLDGKMRSNYVVRENGRKYGMLGLKRCAKINSETGDIDPYNGIVK